MVGDGVVERLAVGVLNEVSGDEIQAGGAACLLDCCGSEVLMGLFIFLLVVLLFAFFPRLALEGSVDTAGEAKVC